jgi:hypothetical protein
MSNVWKSCVVIAVTAATVGIVESGIPAAQQGAAGGVGDTANTTRTSKEELERWIKELSNWGRWGKEDQLGTVNLITPEKRKQAASLVRTGTVVTLAPGVMPQKIGKGGTLPAFVGPPGDSSTLDIAFAGEARTSWVHEQNYYLTSTHHGPHLDAICHVAFEGRTYNGYTLKEIATKDGGCSKMGIASLGDKLVTRGILVDIAAMKGVPQLPPGTHIYKEDIEAFEKWAKVRFEPGDAFLYRLGNSKGSGLDPSFIPFLKQRDIALFGGETAHEAFNVPGFPIAMHTVIMPTLGMPMLDNLDVERLAQTAAKLKRWEFMLVVSPNASTQGTGSQINPVAIF